MRLASCYDSPVRTSIGRICFMTDTSYLYQYFVQNSPKDKKAPEPKKTDTKKEEEAKKHEQLD